MPEAGGIDPAALARAVEDSILIAERLFAALRERTFDGVGITRPTYGEGEEIAHRLVEEEARRLGLEISEDYARNLYMTLPGRDRSGHGIIFGSHLDSVPQGGNYDGAAGVLGGLVAVAALRSLGIEPPTDRTAMAIRGEESVWFQVHHIGSRAALGIVPPAELDEARRVDTDLTLGETMAACGCDVAAMRNGTRHLDPSKVEAFYEIHIEQGPVLVHEEIPVGIVSGIRGNMRARHAKCLGEYAHSGATPRKLRHDAALGMAEFMTAMEAEWEKIEEAGNDLVFTLGKLYTDPDVHTHSKVPGEVRFTIDARSHEAGTLDKVQALVAGHAARIGKKRGLTIDLGPLSRVKPATMAPVLREKLRRGADALGVRAMEIPSGGGHDAGDFANAGVQAAMLFVRNPHGSHNPREDMSMGDFAEAVKLLAWGLTN